MCAIAGILGMDAPEDVLVRMLQTMHHRGPDGSGIYRCRDTALLHSRLAVIDPEGGKQPMELDWGGERYILVYNGELYNTRKIRKELELAGHHFLGHSDTEVVLHAYAQYGKACVERFNGIFAFAVWETKGKRLFLARDRIGVKPFFYMQNQSSLLFASEMKTILAVPGVKAQLDREGAAQLILLGPGRIPGSGVFRGIQELEPGYCGFWEQGKLKLERYWYLKDGISTDSFQETVEKVRDLVMDAISRQMVSDVPIGTFLSGGLDSSIISSVCAAEMANNGKTLDTFSVGYENQEKYFVPGKFQPESDDSYIRIMADTLHSYHHSTLLTPEDLFSHLEAATLARDLPGMADVDSSLLAFCRRIRPHVKVMLSGECADEIFGGYPWYRDPEVRAREGFPWAQNTRQRVGLLRPSIGQNSEDFIREAWEKTLRDSDILPENSPEEKRMKQMVNLNFRWFMQTLLDRKDRMSMYTSLEVRVPFCDHRIAEYLYTVPWVYKDWNGKEKGLLRCAVEGLLPDRVLWRKKSPYPKTFDPRYGELVRIAFRNLLDDRASPVWEIANREEARALIKGETMWPWYGQLMGNVQTMAYFLQIAQWIQAYQVDFCF